MIFKNQNVLIYLTVFFSGTEMMIFELIGSRILAPYIGTSIVVWTSLIGIMLAAFSVGSFMGGKLADKNNKKEFLSIILIVIAILILITSIFHSFILQTLLTISPNLVISSLVSVTLLFAPASILFGMVTPYATKISIKKSQVMGTTIGTIYSIATIGSIIGTFAGGILLPPILGSVNTLYLISFAAAVNSIVLWNKKIILPSILVIFVILIMIIRHNLNQLSYQKNQFIDLDTIYHRVMIYNYTDDKTGKTIKAMNLNGELSSGMHINTDELIYPYDHYRLDRVFNPNIKRGLMIGAAAYAYPKDFIKQNNNAILDVVEIDSELTSLSKTYFKLSPHKKLNIIHQDGRTYLNNTTTIYDVVYFDAYRGQTIPFQLVSQEAVKKTYKILNDNGLVIMNVISAIEGDKGKMFRSVYYTYKTVFPHVYAIPTKPENSNDIQNIFIIALKNPNTNIEKITTDTDPLSRYLNNIWKKPIFKDVSIVTDDHSPIDYYSMLSIPNKYYLFNN